MEHTNVLRRKTSKKGKYLAVSITALILCLFAFYYTFIFYGYVTVNNITSYDLNTYLQTLHNVFNLKYFDIANFSSVINIQGDFIFMYLSILCACALLLLSSPTNAYKNMEHGSARWGNKYEEKKFKDITGIPVAKDLYVPTNNNKVVANLNEIIIGGSGAGKSFRKIKPDILQMNGSYVITDPSGELYRDCAKMLLANGYIVKVLNLVDVEYSNSYNPFEYIETEQDVVNVASLFMKNSAGEGEREDFWTGACLDLLTALMMYLFKSKDETKSFGRVVRLISSIRYKKGAIDESCEIARLLNEHAINHPTDLATINWHSMLGTPMETLGGIVKTLSTRLRLWSLPDVDSFTLEDEMDFDNLGVKKTAIFLIIPAARQTYKVVANIFYSQLFERLQRVAESKYSNNNNRLPLLVNCELDEFANIGEIPSFNETLAVVRKYNIRICIVLQGISQLKAIYEKTFDSIIGNCDIFTFLGSKDMETLEYISKKLGDITVKSDTKSYNRGQGGGGSDSEASASRPLLKPNEIKRAMQQKGESTKFGGKCIVWCGDFDPFFKYKFDTISHPRFKECGSPYEPYIVNQTNLKEVYKNINEERKLRYQRKMEEIAKKQKNSHDKFISDSIKDIEKSWEVFLPEEN